MSDAPSTKIDTWQKSANKPGLTAALDVRHNFVFVGFPTWGMQLPPPMKSFLHQYDLSGKTVIPFNTHAGYGIGSSFKTVEELRPDSNIPEYFLSKVA